VFLVSFFSKSLSSRSTISVRASTLPFRKDKVGVLGSGALVSDLRSKTFGALLKFCLGILRGALEDVFTGPFGRVAFCMSPFPHPPLGKSIPTRVWERLGLAIWKDEVLREDVLSESVVAGRLLGPPTSEAALLMPIIPVVGLRGGAGLILSSM
jgi:hypothetical protein